MHSPSRRAVLAAGIGSLLIGPLLRPARAQTAPALQGKVFVTDRGGVRVHTYMAPMQGALVTSHAVETSRGLVVIDGQFVPDAAREVRRVIDGIGKPVDRLVLSHMHPDHWFGVHHLGLSGVPVFAGPSTAAFLRDNGAALIAERRAETAVPSISGVLSEGSEVIGGVEFRVRRVLDTEAPEMMVIELPAAGIAIVQDLVYSGVHAVVSRQIDEWVGVLRSMERDGTRMPVILAGHGEPTASADLSRMIAYLSAVKPLIGRQDVDAAVAEMSAAFPDHRLAPLLRLGLQRSLRPA